MILLRTMGALALVLALIFAVAQIAKKYLKPSNWAPTAGIRVLQSFNLEPKKKLLVVEVENQKLLLGLSESNISCLCTLSAEVKQKTEYQHAVV